MPYGNIGKSMLQLYLDMEIPFTTHLDADGTITLKQAFPLYFTATPIARLYAFVKSGIGIGSSFFHVEKPLPGREEEIIRYIHTIRYAKDNAYVITGGHFSQLYVRNLGVFFNALLDGRVKTSEDDWLMRQEIALKTVALDLEIFRLAKRDFTTIVPLKENFYTAMNIYTRASDSLFGILYTLCALRDDSFIPSIFPLMNRSSENIDRHQLATIPAVKELISVYKEPLSQLITNYKNEIIDVSTGLIRRDITLASARDGIKRESSFYDNVILWATYRLAGELGILDIKEDDLEKWKQYIMHVFWDEKEEIFLDDLSDETKRSKLFSADSFIVTSSGFLNIRDKKDIEILVKMVRYVQRNKLHSPIPLHYSVVNQSHKLYWPVKVFAPSYMGRSIWSHWGMEYIKALVLLGKIDKVYLAEAREHMEKYKHNIEKYGGYPELYNEFGEILKTRMYRSVLHNGWVINYEQAKLMLVP